MMYLLDTNIIADLVAPRPNPVVTAHFHATLKQDTIGLCEAVLYEVERGWLHRGADQQIIRFHEDFVPLFQVLPVERGDWQLAAKLWAEARRRGKQLSDVDLVLAATTLQLGGVLVTDDADFAALPVPQVNWRR